jgi:hypothetical protein
MKYYIKKSGAYIELMDDTPVSDTLIEVTKRPDDTFDWNGFNWIKTDRENKLNKELRAESYKIESDPLFFQWQKGTKTKQEWLDKIEEIKIKYPKN